MLSRRVLTREEESSAPDTEVTAEDQDKINTFSRLHNRSKTLLEELEAKKKEKEDLEEVTLELELKDEEELVPYRIGDAFVALPVPEAQELLTASTGEVEEEIEKLEEELGGIKEELTGLKAHLYARFGRGINLEA